MGASDSKNPEGTFKRKVLKYFHSTPLMIYLKVTVLSLELQTGVLFNYCYIAYDLFEYWGDKVERKPLQPFEFVSAERTGGIQMILSGKEIRKKLDREIFIDPFNPEQLNPNSYNLRLHNELLVYEDTLLDMKKENKAKSLVIPEEGLILEPNKLYLGRTKEYTRTVNHVPMLEGRSSVGRLGLFIHVTAGFGDVGFSGYWTLEIYCIQPIKVYPGIEICQIYYHSIEGEYDKYSSGKYQNNTGIQPSLLYKDFEKKQL